MQESIAGSSGRSRWQRPCWRLWSAPNAWTSSRCICHMPLSCSGLCMYCLEQTLNPNPSTGAEIATSILSASSDLKESAHRICSQAKHFSPPVCSFCSSGRTGACLVEVWCRKSRMCRCSHSGTVQSSYANPNLMDKATRVIQPWTRSFAQHSLGACRWSAAGRRRICSFDCEMEFSRKPGKRMRLLSAWDIDQTKHQNLQAKIEKSDPVSFGDPPESLSATWP